MVIIIAFTSEGCGENKINYLYKVIDQYPAHNTHSISVMHLLFLLSHRGIGYFHLLED